MNKIRLKSHIFFLSLCIGMALSSRAQQPVFNTGFENNSSITTVNGITGMKALDLTENSADRRALRLPLSPIKDNSMTISVWARASLKSGKGYVIASSLKKRDKYYDGWKISVQPSGAWKFEVRKGKVYYEYNPTDAQTIRDGNWHLLTVSYLSKTNDLSFYYDGRLKAIYNAWGIEGAFSQDSVMIGNSLDDPHLFHTYSGKTSDNTEWDTFYGQINQVKIFDVALSPEKILNNYNKITGRRIQAHVYNKDTGTLKVMQFNIWHGGNETGRETGVNRLINLLKKNNADVYTFVETYGSGEKIADALGYNFYLVSSNLSIMSRYPIIKTFRIYHSFKSGGVQLSLPGNRRLNVFVVWLDYLPDYEDGFPKHQWKSVKDYMKEEMATRGHDIKEIMEGIDSIGQMNDSLPVIIAGDFNSGSHLDWTVKTKNVHFGYTIPWPGSIRVYASGFKDAYREIHPDPINDPGITWSVVNHGSPENYQYDRLDYIYYKGYNMKVSDAYVTDRSLVKFPSDHAAVTALFKWNDEIR